MSEMKERVIQLKIMLESCHRMERRALKNSIDSEINQFKKNLMKEHDSCDEVKYFNIARSIVKSWEPTPQNRIEYYSKIMEV